MNSDFSHSRDFQKTLENLSRLDFMQKILSGEVPQPAMRQTLEFHLSLLEVGSTVFEGATTPAQKSRSAASTAVLPLPS